MTKYVLEHNDGKFTFTKDFQNVEGEPTEAEQLSALGDLLASRGAVIVNTYTEEQWEASPQAAALEVETAVDFEFQQLRLAAEELCMRDFQVPFSTARAMKLYVQNSALLPEGLQMTALVSMFDQINATVPTGKADALKAQWTPST